jgi:hypothetical protein
MGNRVEVMRHGGWGLGFRLLWWGVERCIEIISLG